MNNKYAGLLAVAVLLAVAAYFVWSERPEPEPLAQVLDEHADHDPEALAEAEAFVPVVQAAPANGYLCAGLLSVSVPGDEQEFPESFSMDLDSIAGEAVVAGLWPSPQFLPELQPPFWQTETDPTNNALLITGIGITAATSLTSRISFNPGTLQYAISWSVLPVGFRTPVEFWASAGTCEAFGDVAGL